MLIAKNFIDLKSVDLYIKGKFYSFDNSEFSRKDQKHYCIDIHNHVDVEIIYVKTGQLKLALNNLPHDLKSGDIAIFNPYDIHEAYFLRSEPTVEYYYLRIDLSAFTSPRLKSINQLLCSIDNQVLRFPNIIPKEHPQSNTIRESFLSTFEAYKATLVEYNVSTEATLCSCIYNLLPSLSALVKSDDATILGSKEIKFINDITKYISKNYNEPIGVADMCRALSCSKSNLYRMFDVCFKESPSVYLRNYRILRAAIEYRHSDMSISDIALAVGFSDYCYFSKSFKKRMGISPKKFFAHSNTKNQDNS